VTHPAEYGRNRGFTVIDAKQNANSIEIGGRMDAADDRGRVAMQVSRDHRITRREFAQGMAGGMIMAIGTQTHASAAAVRDSIAARTVAGVRMIDSKLARAAIELSRDVSPPYLFNHAMRTYLFGALIGRTRGQTWDAEVLCLACVLHDLGLSSRFAGDLPFEIQGADAAVHFLRDGGLTKRRSRTVWDGIAMHPYAIAARKQPEIALVAAGAAADVIGADLSLVTPHAQAEVIRAYPRLNFKHAFVNTCAEVVRKHPRGASRSFMRDIGERHVADYRAANICDAIEASPFDE
jgi:hypothetical protein